MQAHRHHLHRHPEVGLELPDTHAYIVDQLTALGFTPEHHPGTGVSVVIEGSRPDYRPLVLRSDMDALPVTEASGEEFSSQRPGAMHACGHDLHMAMLLGVAEMFGTEQPLRTLILAFQPGEEADRGALHTLTHRTLDVGEAETFALHVNAVLPSGEIHYSRGIFMAFGDWFEVSVQGPGGHASAPERVGNPIHAGALIEGQLGELAHTLSTPDARVVATVTEFLSGNTVNVIPTTAGLRGTVRTVTRAQRDTLHSEMARIVRDTSSSLGLSGELVIHEGYPAVECSPDFVDYALDVFASKSIGRTTEMDHPSMVIEDFSYFLHKWPGAMMYLGASVGDEPAFNHSPTARFDDQAMRAGLEMFRALAMAPPA